MAKFVSAIHFSSGKTLVIKSNVVDFVYNLAKYANDLRKYPLVFLEDEDTYAAVNLTAIDYIEVKKVEE